MTISRKRAYIALGALLALAPQEVSRQIEKGAFGNFENLRRSVAVHDARPGLN